MGHAGITQVPGLVKLLLNRFFDIQGATAEALGKVEILKPTLLDVESDVRVRAAECLGNLGVHTKEAVHSLWHKQPMTCMARSSIHCLPLYIYNSQIGEI